MARFYPKEGTKQYALLRELLNGEEVDVLHAYLHLNLPTVQARAAELRRMGWPVRSIERPHPRLAGETVVVYVLDKHFRIWIGQNAEAHPSDYPCQDGRGKFADWTAEDYHADGL